MKFEEVLPAFKNGKKIRRKAWYKKYFIYREGLFVYKEDGGYYHFMNCDQLLCDDWEIIEEPEPDWSYIIKNKCLCRFWDIDSEEVLSCKFRYLKEVDSRKTFPYKDDFGYTWKHCRPVRKDEFNFYEGRKDKEDEDS